jgi:Tol biopolymer transport system component
MEAFFCPDGKTIFFAPYDEGMDVRIWRVETGPDGFGVAQELQSPVNQGAVFYPTCASSGALYYSNIIERKIYRVEPGDGTYASTEDTGLTGAGHCYIAPDEQYALIDSRREGGFGDSDIYLVRKNGNGSWAEPINLGEQVNTHFSETCPSLSPDEKYIFFSRYNEPNEVSDIYWVSSDVIKRHLP